MATGENCGKCSLQEYCDERYDIIADERANLGRTATAATLTFGDIASERVIAAQAIIDWQAKPDYDAEYGVSRNDFAELSLITTGLNPDQIAALKADRSLFDIVVERQKAVARVEQAEKEVRPYNEIYDDLSCELGPDEVILSPNARMYACNHPKLTPQQRNETKHIEIIE